MADGSLTFDTKVNTDGFKEGASTLEKALDRLKESVDRLSRNIEASFNGAGNAAAVAADKSEQAAGGIESIGDAAKQTEQQVKSLQEQMDAIHVTFAEDTPISPIPSPTTEPISGDPGYDPKAMAATFGEAAAGIRNYSEAVQQYGNQAGAVLNEMEKGTAVIEEVASSAEQGAERVEHSCIGIVDSVKMQLKNMMSFTPKIPGMLMDGVSKITKVPGIIKGAFSKASKTIATFGGSLKSLGVKAKSAVSNLKKLVPGANKASKSVLKLSNMFKLMLIRMAMRSVIQGVKEGMQNLVQYSDETNRSVSSLMTGMTYLKNSFAAAFAPVSTYVVPVLNVLIDALATALGYLNQFLSAISGKTTYTKAVRANEDYAASLKKTGNEAKKVLAPFDDLVQIQNESSSSGSGAGSADPSQMFTEETITGEIRGFADRIQEMLAADDWSGIGQLLGEKVNEAIDSIDYSGIGSRIGYAINGAVQTAYYFLDTVNFTNIGKHIAELINSGLEQIDFTFVGATVVKWFTLLPDLVIGFLSELDWGLVAKSVSDFFIGAFDEATKWLNQYDWSQLGADLWTNIKIVFANIDWSSIAISMFTLLGTALRSAGQFLGEFFGSIGADIKMWWDSEIQGQSWSETAVNLLCAIGEGFADIGTWVWDNIVDPFCVALLGENTWADVKEVGKNIIEGLYQGILDFFADPIEWIKTNIVDPFVNGIKSLFGIHSPSTVMAEMGQYLWDGFCNGIKEFFANPIDFIKANITDPFVDGVKGLLGIHSPSTVMKEVASDAVSGFNLGVEDNQSSTQSIVQSWASGVANWFASKLGIGSGDSEEAKRWANSTISGFNNTVSAGYVRSRSIMEKWADQVRSWFVGTTETRGVNEVSWRKFANDIITAFADEISGKHAETQLPVETWAENLRSWFTGTDEKAGVNETSWMKFARDIIQAFKAAITGNHALTMEPMETWARHAREWFWGDSDTAGTGGMYAAFYDMAKRINEGFAKGISDFADMAKAAIQEWASEIMEAAEEEFDINSPSKEFQTIAQYVVKGFDKGILAGVSESVSTARKWLDGVMSVFDGVDISVPVGLDTSRYMPKIATGSVVPPRAGEASVSMRGSSAQDDMLSLLISRLDELMQQLSDDNGTPIELVLNLSGNMAALAKILKPELDKEAARKGVKLVVVGGA